MIVYSDVTVCSNIQNLAFTQRALCVSLGQFIAVINGFAAMPEFGNSPLNAIEIDALISFWSETHE